MHSVYTYDYEAQIAFTYITYNRCSSDICLSNKNE